MRRIARAWGAYWFGRDGRLSLEVVRITLALSALLVWDRISFDDYGRMLAKYSEGTYQPIGILQLLGSSPPAPLFLEACKWLALLSSLAMLVGFASRAASVTCAVTTLLIAAVAESFAKGWSHSLSPVLLALVAFAPARSGRALSVDALLRRRRGEAAEGFAAAWPVLLLQLVVAFPFFNAAIWKLRHGSGLRWALSDSLRHHILTQFDWSGNQRTLLADMLVRSAPLWKTAALVNIACQLAPMLACFFVRRPLVRLLLGCVFVIEVVALDVVMGLPNYQWLPLAAVFVDWDHFARRWRRQAVSAPSAPSPVEAAGASHPLASAFIGLFVAVSVLFTVGPGGLDLAGSTYPFSQYRMFSGIRAKRPYSVHQTWEFDTVIASLEAGNPEAGPAAAADIRNRFRRFAATRSPAEVKRLLEEAQRRAHRAEPRSVTLGFYILQAPAYPAEPVLASHEIGVLGRLRGSRFQSLLGTAGTDDQGPFVVPRPVGLKPPPELSLSYLLDGDPTLRPLPTERRGDRLYYRPTERGRYLFVAEVGGERFIVAQTRHRRPKAQDQPADGAD